MTYSSSLLPYNLRCLGEHWLAVSSSGDHIFLDDAEAESLRAGDPQSLPLSTQAALKSRFFLRSEPESLGSARLLAARRSARHETLKTGPSLHIIVPTLQCAHSCQYCQVSRALEDNGHTMPLNDLYAACDSIFDSNAPALTIEFQGGDPLLRYDLVQAAILRIVARNEVEKRSIRFVVASTLHQLNEDMCDFFKQHQVYLSTSLDGPASLHNQNRPTPTRDSYQKTIRGIGLARQHIGKDSVSALMTTAQISLKHPEVIVDEYAYQQLPEIFLRPLSLYGFAKRNQTRLGYTLNQFQMFYERALDRIIEWNRRGVYLREVYASIILNKILSPLIMAMWTYKVPPEQVPAFLFTTMMVMFTPAMKLGCLRKPETHH